MSNTTKTSIELAEALLTDYCRGLYFVPAGIFDDIKKIYQAEINEAYNDGKEAAIIKQCAEESTSAASANTEAFGIGYDQGYNRALDLVEWKIKNELKTTK
jgi:UTP-glucose-1-phosphate uridylyltransferase